MYNTFGELPDGAVFNTKPARYIKINDTMAIVIISGVLDIGRVIEFDPDNPVIYLYSDEDSKRLMDISIEAEKMIQSEGLDFMDYWDFVLGLSGLEEE